MQKFELLGGKYQQGEQILPGAIQSFRGYELPTGRPVFIHRIPSKEEAAQEIAGLLSASLVRSAAVRKAVLDVYEGEPYRFLVTEPDRHCIPLRDWLEREAGELRTPVTNAPAEEIASRPLQLEAAAPAPAEEAKVEEPPISPEAEATEFARIFRAALAGKMERVRRDTPEEEPVVGYGPTGQPAIEEEEAPDEETFDEKIAKARARVLPALEPPKLPAPSSSAAPASSATPELFSHVADVEKSGRSNLVVFLVVLGGLVVLLVMFVVVFAKR